MNYQEKWARNIAALEKFVARYGHSNVPSAYSYEEESTVLFLGPWVSKVRSQYRAGKLAPHRARELEMLPGWRWDSSRPGPRVEADRDSGIVTQFDNGVTTRQIADELNITTQRVNQIIRKNRSEK